MADSESVARPDRTSPGGGQDWQTRCGFVAVIGPPNAGKSTLVNRLTGAKVSIVTPKAQTTRTRVLGIVIAGSAQVILVDTPGIFSPRSRMDRAMLATAWRGAVEADFALLLADAKADPLAVEPAIEGLQNHASATPAMLALNKIDLVPRPSLLSLAESLNSRSRFRETFMIAALKGDGVDHMLSVIAAALPPGPWLFPEDQITDAPQRLLAGELTREQVFLRLRQELPYAAAVETESWQEFDNGDLRLEQVIIVERDSQKGMVIGKGGGRIKEIGAAARQEIAAAFDRKVHLFLRVKVRAGWREDSRRLRALGLEGDI